MPKIVLLIGWPIAALLALGLVQERVRSNRQAEVIAELERDLAPVEAAPRDRAQAPAPATGASSAPTPPSRVPPSSNEPASEPEPAASEAADPDSANSLQKSLLSFVKGMLDEDPSGPRARIMIETQYGELLDQLELDPERALAVQIVLAEHTARSVREATDLLSGDSAPGADRPAVDLREQLSTYLSEDELAEFDAYEAEAPARNLRRRYSMELGMFAPDLRPDTRDRVLSVMVEEQLIARDSRRPSPSSAATRAIAVVDRALERLDPLLQSEERAELARFFRMQYASAELTAQMTESMELERKSRPR